MTPAGRIAAMKARQEQQLRREKEDEERRERARLRPLQLVGTLAADLSDCDGLQLMTSDRRGYCAVWIPSQRLRTVTPSLRVLLRNGSGDHELIRFAVAGDFDTGDVYLTHDDDRVTHDQAVDLALATVEKYLYDESNNSGTVAKEESEIPL